LTGDILLRDIDQADLPTFFEQQLDPAANYMAAFTAKDPADKAAFTAKWAKIFGDHSITMRTIIFEGHVAGSVLSHGWFGKPEISWQANAKALYEATLTGRAFVAVADADGQVAGYCNLRSWPAGGWVDQIVVSKGHRRWGVGSALLDAVVAAARERGFWKVSLITSDAASGARSFFQARGWEVVGKMRDEITKGVDGILLSRIVDYELHPNA
jgi:GNAT superfamily N-acetyltransferase